MRYSFKCLECNETFDLVLSGFLFTNKDSGAVCPKCHTGRSVVKVFTVPQIIFRGKGWAVKDAKQVKSGD